MPRGAIDIQDVLVVPGRGRHVRRGDRVGRRGCGAAPPRSCGAAGTTSPSSPTRVGSRAPLASNREAIEVVVRGIERAGLEPGAEAAIALDVAATELCDGETGYRLAAEGRRLDDGRAGRRDRGLGRRRSRSSRSRIRSARTTPLWPGLTHVLGGRLQLVGDDRFVTSPERLAAGIEGGVANAVLVKPNQCGTLTEALEVVEHRPGGRLCDRVSARSGETEDAWLADLAVGWRAGQIKVGSTQRSERTAKWNRLLRIEAEEPDAVFAGRAALAPRR